MKDTHLPSESTSSYPSLNPTGDMQHLQERLFDKRLPERTIVLPNGAEIKTVAGREMKLLATEFPSNARIRGGMVWGIAFSPPRSLYAITSKVFAKMDPKGKVESSLNLGATDWFVDMSVCKRTNAVYVLSTRQLMYSNDGKNWNQLNPPFVGRMTKIGVASNRIAICNSDGSVCFSEDGGQTWLHTPQIRAKDLCIPYDDPNRFFVLGWDGSVLIVQKTCSSCPPLVIDTKNYPAARSMFIDGKYLYCVSSGHVVRRNLEDDSQAVERTPIYHVDERLAVKRNPEGYSRAVERRSVPIPQTISAMWAKRYQTECCLIGGTDDRIYLLKLNDNTMSRHPVLALYQTSVSDVAVGCYHNICCVGGPWPYLLITHNWGNTWFVVPLDNLFFE